ncbi:(R)-mandelonitrile lyase [Pseudaestuariivita atlantica]|uniref:Cupin n=1 Tax=Pseudaestuariivita atlantica TaxID=1317121 RepID=A0A0L1JMG2_9RHOB|nr:cupin domain-containing protein [Pseudaestuariivita atlantica]KNG92931.1 cupin [Pseudaestuariivita atlantica]
MDHHSAGDRPDRPGPAEYFTGDVTLTPIIEAPLPAQLRALSVTFQPGARTAWHTHPRGQTIFVTAGEGRAQRRGGPVITLKPGDTVFFHPDEEHWHGAAPDAEMTHVAMQEADDSGTHVTWLDHVSDADYTA